MEREFKALDIEGLKAYRIANPIKFKHKYGEIDFENLPEHFNLFIYKAQVARERSLMQETGDYSKVITPWTFAPKKVEVKAEVEPEVEANDEEVVEEVDKKEVVEEKVKKAKKA